MSNDYTTDNPELEALFDRYRRSPEGFVFAPLADACRKAGMLEEAIEICEKGVSSHPGYASGYVVRGKCYYDLGNADQAEASFEKVLELDANNLVALKFMGIILAERGQARDARRYFEHILALDPEDREIRSKLEEIGELDANIDAALATELNEVLGDEDAEGTLERDDAGDGEPVELRPVEDEGFVGAEITLGDGNQTPDVLATITLADIYASQGYRRKAVKIYTELLEAQPGNREIREKLRKLGVDSGTPPVTPPAGGQDAAAEPAPEVDVPASTDGDELADEPADGADAPAPPASTPFEPAPVRRDERNAAHFKRWLENFTR